VKPVPSYVHAEWKKNSSDGERAKARVIVLGDQDKTQAETYSPTPESCILFTILFLSLCLNFSIGFGDVKTAFLNAPLNLEKRIYMRLPMNIPDYVTEKYPTFVPGRVVRVKKSVYGLRYCPRSYYTWFLSKLLSLGYIEVMPCVYVLFKDKKIESMMYVHVDDAMIGCEIRARDLENEYTRLRAGGIPFGECVHVGEVSKKFLGVHIDMHDDSVIHVSTHKYVKNVIDGMTSDESRVAHARKLVRGEFLIQSKEVMEKEKDMTLHERYREYTGKLGWAIKASPLHVFLFSYLSMYGSRPSKRVFNMLLKSFVYMYTRPSCVTLRKIRGAFKVPFWFDVSYCSIHRPVHSGYCVQYVSIDDNVCEIRSKNWDNVVEVQSKKLPGKVRSAPSMELHSMEECVVNAFKYKNLFDKLYMNVKYEFVTDSQPVLDQMKNGYMQTEYELQPVLEYCIERVNKMHADVYWIPTAYMLADGMTKFLLQMEGGDCELCACPIMPVITHNIYMYPFSGVAMLYI